jgi:hypothetical protein
LPSDARISVRERGTVGLAEGHEGGIAVASARSASAHPRAGHRLRKSVNEAEQTRAFTMEILGSGIHDFALPPLYPPMNRFNGFQERRRGILRIEMRGKNKEIRSTLSFPHFKTGALNRSVTHPHNEINYSARRPYASG